MATMTEKPDNFQCIMCGNCCRQEGYVRLKEKEPDRIAEYLGMDIYAFIETYTILTRDRQTLSLKDKSNGECIFLSDTGCRINAVKPDQCLDFPYRWKFKAFDTVCGWAKQQR